MIYMHILTCVSFGLISYVPNTLYNIMKTPKSNANSCTQMFVLYIDRPLTNRRVLITTRNHTSVISSYVPKFSFDVSAFNFRVAYCKRQAIPETDDRVSQKLTTITQANVFPYSWDLLL
jgi:hypothetical protein